MAAQAPEEPSSPPVRTLTRNDGADQASATEENHLIILGIILIIVGLLVESLKILFTIGIILLIVGVVLALLGRSGRAIGGRNHWY